MTTEGDAADPSIGNPDDAIAFDDVESSEAAVGEAFYPHAVTVHGKRSEFRGSLTLMRLGPLVIGNLDYNRGITLKVPQVDGYHLNMALAGGLTSTSNGREVLSNFGTAALYQQDSDALIRTSSGTRFAMLAVHIDQAPLDLTLAGLLGRPPSEALHFAPKLDLRSGQGRQWWDLLVAIAALHRRDSLLANPLVAQPLGESLLSGLLFATEHQYSDRIRAETKQGGPLLARRAEEYILSHLGEPLTIAEVAYAVGASTRSLQRAFSAHYGMGPKDFIRARRLERVHADLVASDPTETTVTATATAWGFGHLGRFAHDYRAAYGVPPAHTLRT